MGESLELGILGPLQVRLSGNPPVALGGVRQRAVLAVLALNAGQVVSTDRLVDDLWGENPPARAVHTIRVFVSRLRTQLAGASDRLITRPPGYVLDLRPDEIDALRCERLYNRACGALAHGDAARAASMLSEAQALWRGPPLAEFTYEPFAQASIARLEELRFSCREELIEAQLALGRHAEVVADLEALVREQPFRERPRGQLMLALYRCGRQADALEAFQEARLALVEELAVEPSEALRELEQLILRQDASLAPASLSVEPPGAVAGDGGDGGRDGGPSEPPPASPPAAVVAEPAPAIVRKSATVLVAELATIGRADPEMTRNAIALARTRAQEIVTRHGGAFVAGLGGEVVWVFGVPLVNEDDALRALRASLELAAEFEGGPVTVRVGVASGEVVVESATDLFGEPLSRGVALAQAAQTGTVLLSDVTRRLVAGSARVEGALDGDAWRLDGLLEHEPREPTVHPHVDRVDELALAAAAFRRAVRAREAHLLTVLGEPGIGKSRLGEESASRLAGEATVLTGHCLSYGDGVDFWPLREALSQFGAGDSAEAIRGLLGDAEDADLVAEIVSASLGLTDSETRREQIPWAFRRLLELVARERPLELVIEDTHWAAPDLLDLIDYLVDWVKAPVLLLNTARPELLDGRPAWGGGHPRVSSIVLGPLSDDDAGSLLDQRLGDRQLSHSERSVILETADGNPLFVEQLLAMSAENPWWDREREIPGTLRSLLAARIDRLGPGERAYIERAAIVGREFWPTAVMALLPEEARSTADQHLRALVRRGLIQPGSTPLAGEEQLRFHHILIRDVAYRGTPKALRSELHERFAEWVVATLGEAYEEFVGYHLERAFRNLAEVGGSGAHAAGLAGRAAESLSNAGRRALSRGNPNAAVQLLRSAVEMCEAAHRKRPDILLDLGNALSESGDYAEAEGVLQAALAQARVTGAEAVSARALIELSYQRSHVDASLGAAEMRAVAEQTIEVFDRLGDEGGLARAWLHIALVEWIRSDSAAMDQALQRALTHAERAGDRRDQSRILIDLARTTVVGPRPARDGIRRCQELLARAEGDIAATAFTEAMLAVLEAMDGQFDGARARWRRSKRRLAEVGLSVSVAVIQMYYGYIEMLANRPENAESELAAACIAFDQLGTRGHLSSAAGLAARVYYADGSYDESTRYCRMSEEAASSDDAVSQVLWRGTRAKLLARAGEFKTARALADDAVRLADETDFLMMRGDALTDRAEVLTVLDKPQEAGADLAAATELYERKGISAAVNPARRALALAGGVPNR
ncbi:MAG: BTAD domain-containing putative transcriptional regulator [Solirubrobacteraceae bacterium]